MKLLTHGKRKIFFSLFAALALILGATPAAFAEEAESTETAEIPAVWLQISPPTNRITITGGTTADYTFEVENIGSEAFDFRVYAAPFSAANDSYEYNFSTETSYTQISRWVTFATSDGSFASEARYHLDVGQKQTITYRVTTPASIPAGGQYATLFAESINDSAADASAGIKTVSRVGLILYANSSGDTIQEAEITDYDYTNFLFSGNLAATAKVANTGNTDFGASYNFTVKTLFGETVYEDSTSSYILPESERRVDVEWANTPIMGIFQVNYRVTAANLVEDHTSIVIVLPIFVLIIALLLLTVIIIWIIILIRKRRERKSRLL